MGFLEWARARLGGGLRPHERIVLEAVGRSMSDDARQRLGLQVQALSRVSRAAQDKEVIFHGAALSDETRFAFDAPLALLATTWLRIGNGEVRAEMWTASGALTSLTFSDIPAKWSKEKIEVRRVVVWDDPMRSPPALGHIDTKRLQQWLGTLPCSRDELHAARGPLPPPFVERGLEALACEVPSDWRELVQICDGVRCGGISIHGLSDARVVVLPDTELVLIAENEGPEVLVLDRRNGRGRVFAEDLEQQTRRDVGDSVREAVRGLMERHKADE